ncbi:MAG TPA: tetratricopeptide repeat protein [Thermodesulfobacteriota bacterium]|nr:tetratricopeptide repeat protein [Thermodesulfobacteriota bacterium]
MSDTDFPGLLAAADWKRYLSQESGFKCLIAGPGALAREIESALGSSLLRLGVTPALHLTPGSLNGFEALAVESFMGVVIFGDDGTEASFYEYGYLKGSGKTTLAFSAGKETGGESADGSGLRLPDGFFSGYLEERLSEKVIARILESVPGALARYMTACAVRDSEGRPTGDVSGLSERLAFPDSGDGLSHEGLVSLDREFSEWSEHNGIAVPPEILLRLAFLYTRTLENGPGAGAFAECRERALSIYESMIARGCAGLPGALARKKLADVLLFYPAAPDGGGTENIERAESLYRQALGMTDPGVHSRERSSMLNNLGLALAMLGVSIGSGDYVKAAADSFAASLSEGGPGFSAHEKAIVDLNLGAAYSALGEYGPSVGHLVPALEFYNEYEYPAVNTALRRTLGAAYSALADERLGEGDMEGAAGYLGSAAFAYRTRSLSGEHAHVRAREGRVLSDLALGNNDCSRAIQAIDCYNDASDYYGKAGCDEEHGPVREALSALYEFLGGYEAPTPDQALRAYAEIADACADGASPAVYARAMVKLGGIYEALAAEEDRIYNREKAIESYFNSLAYYNLENRPEEFAAMKIRLAGIYRDLAALLEEPGLYNRSIYSCRQALRVYTAESVPEVYGELMADIGEACGALTVLEGGGDHLLCAMEAYESALGVYRALGGEEASAGIRDSICALYPLLEGICEKEPGKAASVCRKYLSLLGEWAGPSLRAGVLEKLGDGATGAVWEVRNKDNYIKTVEIYKEALGLIQQDPSSGGFERLSFKIGSAYKILAEIEAAEGNPAAAAEYYDEAFVYFPEEAAEAEYAAAGRVLGGSFRRLYEAGGGADDCRKAIAAFWEALKYDESSGGGEGRGETAEALAGLYTSLAELEEREGRAGEALECYAELLSLYDPDRFPSEYAEAQRRIAGFYTRLAETEDRSINLGLAIASYKEALSYYAESGTEAIRCETAGLVSALYRALGGCPDASPDMKIGYYQEAISYGDASPSVYESLGMAYMAAAGGKDAAGNLQKAAGCFRKALDSDGLMRGSPEYGRVQASLGAVYEDLAAKTGDTEFSARAREALAAALEAFPRDGFPSEHEDLSERLAALDVSGGEASGENTAHAESGPWHTPAESSASGRNASAGEKRTPGRGSRLDGVHKACPVFYEEDIPEDTAAAVEHCRKRLGEVSQADCPKAYASLLYALGKAHLKLAAPGGGLDNYLKAIDSFTQSLRVYDVNGSPAEYAEIRKQMALAYSGLARTNGDPDYYVRAVRAFREALEFYTFERCPEAYGFIKRNLASAYEGLSAVSDKIANLGPAAAAYEEALRHYTYDRFPEEHVAILVSLGPIYQLLAEVVDRAVNCRKAIECYDMILSACNLEDHPEEYAGALNNLGVVYRMLAAHEDKAENCTRALGCYARALKVYTEKDYPVQYGSTKNNVGLAYMTLADARDRESNCKEALKAFEDALRVRTIQGSPMQFAATQNNLGIVYRMLSEIEDRARNCKRAIDAYETALIIYSADKFPLEYATTRNNIGGAYSTLAEEEDALANCDKAAKSYREALKVFTRDRFPGPHEVVKTNLERLFEFYGKDLPAH